MTTDIKMQPVSVEQPAEPKTGRYSEQELKRLKKACADFESIFTYQLIKTMRQTVPQNKMGMGNYGKDTYTMMMDQKLAESISTNGNGLGLKKVLYDQLVENYKTTTNKEVTKKLK